MPTQEEASYYGKLLGLLGLSFVPGAGAADAAGMFPSPDGGFEPSLEQNWNDGNYFTAGLQALGAAGDATYAVPLLGATVGTALKAPRKAQVALKTGKAAGRASKADNIAAGLYHPIGAGNKLPKPPSEMTSKLIPVDVPPPQTITPESLLGGKLIPAVGDRSRVGGLLTEVDGTPLANPVLMEGGEGFMRTHAAEQSAWASDKPVISGLAKMTQSAGKDGAPVYMVYAPMGQTAVDYSTLLTDSLVQQLPNVKITNKAAKLFDDEVRKLVPDFVGVKDPRLLEQLRNNGPLRLAFAKRMDLADMQKLGFPSVAATRLAITEPSLLDLPSHQAGSSIARLDPTGRVITDPAKPHTTYSTQLGGEYVGGFEVPVPRDIMFPDWAAGRRAEGKDPFGDRRAFEMNTASRIQNADQKWLDGVMEYVEKAKRGLLDF